MAEQNHNPAEIDDQQTAAQAPDSAAVEPAVPAPTQEEQLHAALAERDTNLQNWLRSQADLENYRRRVQKELEEERQYRGLPLVRDLLPGIDNLHRAVDAATKTSDVQHLIEGVQLVIKQFDDILASHSVLPIDAIGKVFDPNLHQAVQQVPTAEHPPMTIVAEFQRGYTLHDRVVRPSMVVVAAAPEESA